MMQLISLFQEANYKITFATTAIASDKSVDLQSKGISVMEIKLNDASFDEFIFGLQPSVVLFDRFISEEQFGWRVAENLPTSLRVLDTEDLHFLRKAREESVTKAKPLNLFSETAKRELASILRCDLSLLISEYEMHLLTDTFKIPLDLLFYLPFLVEPITQEQQNELPSFEKRSGFMTIGNLLHAPNVDSIRYLKQDIWPGIREQLPKAELYVYGHYAPQQIMQMHRPSDGFFIKGWAPSVHEAMITARVCLAPLRFGAGLKGKLLDAMIYGTPAITTTLGAEGIYGQFEPPGSVEKDIQNFVDAAVRLHNDKGEWQDAQQRGFQILDKRFIYTSFSKPFQSTIKRLGANLMEHRQQHFMGQLLQQQTLQATKYMSKWIEEKNKSKND